MNDIQDAAMTRKQFKDHLSKVYDAIQPAILAEDDPSKAKLIDIGFTIFSGIIDAILEIRDNSQEAAKENPFGAEFQERVGKP